MKIGDEEVVTLRKAADMLGVSRKTLVAQAAKGALRAVLDEGRYWVTPEEVERYRRENLGKRGNYDHKTAVRKPRSVPVPAPQEST